MGFGHFHQNDSSGDFADGAVYQPNPIEASRSIGFVCYNTYRYKETPRWETRQSPPNETLFCPTQLLDTEAFSDFDTDEELSDFDTDEELSDFDMDEEFEAFSDFSDFSNFSDSDMDEADEEE